MNILFFTPIVLIIIVAIVPPTQERLKKWAVQHNEGREEHLCRVKGTHEEKARKHLDDVASLQITKRGAIAGAVAVQITLYLTYRCP